MNKLIIPLLFLLLIGCKNDNTKQKTTEAVVVKQSFFINGKELLKNVKFNRWDTNARPTNWIINETFEKPEDFVIDRDTLDLLLKGTINEKVFIKQKLILEPNSLYVFSGNISTQLKNSSYAGVVISNENIEIGKTIFKKNKRDYTVAFNSGNGDNIELYIGFINKGKGDIKVKSLSLKKANLDWNYYDSPIANMFFKYDTLDLSTEENFDKSIESIIKRTSEILLASKRNDSLNLINGNEIKPQLIMGSQFGKYLDIAAEKATHSFPSKLTYSAIEILSEFNIGTQRIELYKNSKRIHLILNYYNPFSLSWKSVDPFYNSRVDLNLIDFAGIDKSQIFLGDFGGLSKNIDGLISKYSNAEIRIKKEKTIGYPY